MDLALVSDAIETRITGDTGSGGLYETGAQLINTVGFDTLMGGESPPYIIVEFPGSDEDDTFPDNAVDITVDFRVVTLNRHGSWSDDSAILKRLKERMHRWQMTLAGYNATLMGRVTGSTQHGTDNRQYIERYEVRVEEA
jgi:hypothetical protein